MRLAHHLIAWESQAKREGQPLDLDRAFEAITAIGYEGVELGGDERTLGSPDALQRRLADHGLALAAFDIGVTANPWPPNTEEYRHQLDYAAELGADTIMVCGGFLPEPRRTAFESDYALFGENLTAALTYAARYGQTLAFHPHCGCIVETTEEVGRLLPYVPDTALCVDTGHLAAVRSDPVALIERYPEQIRHLHLKDWDPVERRFTELGQGRAGLDFARVLAALDRIGYSGWLAVECDDPQALPAESARLSYAFLMGLPAVLPHG